MSHRRLCSPFVRPEKQKKKEERGVGDESRVCKRQRRTRVAIVFGVCSLPGSQPTAVVALRDHTGEEMKRAKRVNGALKIKKRRVQHRRDPSSSVLFKKKKLWLQDHQPCNTIKYCAVRYKGGIVASSSSRCIIIIFQANDFQVGTRTSSWFSVLFLSKLVSRFWFLDFFFFCVCWQYSVVALWSACAVA